jgi:bis(5'-nucleosidyl)-tetraphosphatase
VGFEPTTSAMPMPYPTGLDDRPSTPSNCLTWLLIPLREPRSYHRFSRAIYNYNSHTYQIFVLRVALIERSVGAVITYKNKGAAEESSSHRPSEFLLLKNRRGFWGFPQGHKEKGENEIQTLVREVSEETGISSLDIKSYIGKIHYSYFRSDGMKSKKEVSFYFAVTESKTVDISYEHYEFRWAPFTHALFLLRHEQLKLIMVKGRRKGFY